MRPMDSLASTLLETVERETGPSPTWSVIWLHGLGADGHDFEPIVPELVRRDWPAVRFVFPHAPVRAVTINNGARMRAWYDIRDFDLANRADETGVAESVEQVEALVAREVERGIPRERIVLAGFSQGGAITLAWGLRTPRPLAGLVALSTYLPSAQKAGEFAAAEARTQPVFMAHGRHDPMIQMGRALASREALERLGYKVEWREYAMPHSVCAQEIADLAAFLVRIL